MKTKYVVKLEGKIVGTRNSDRVYTHAVVTNYRDGKTFLTSLCGTEALAVKAVAALKSRRAKGWESADALYFMVPVEVEGGQVAPAPVAAPAAPAALPPVKKLAGFTASDAGGAVFTCEDCGKRTRQTIAIELGTEKCLPCTVKAYAQNEHLDKHDFNGVQHTGEFSMDTCPACKAYGAWLTAEYKK